MCKQNEQSMHRNVNIYSINKARVGCKRVMNANQLNKYQSFLQSQTEEFNSIKDYVIETRKINKQRAIIKIVQYVFRKIQDIKKINQL